MARRIAKPETRRFALAIGRAIYHLRKQKGMKAQVLGFELGVSQQSVSNWETGKSLIELATLIDVGHALGTPASTILRLAEKSLWRADGLANARRVFERDALVHRQYTDEHSDE